VRVGSLRTNANAAAGRANNATVGASHTVCSCVRILPRHRALSCAEGIPVHNDAAPALHLPAGQPGHCKTHTHTHTHTHVKVTRGLQALCRAKARTGARRCIARAKRAWIAVCPRPPPKHTDMSGRGRTPQNAGVCLHGKQHTGAATSALATERAPRTPCRITRATRVC
jgi:hypothetical protein